MEIPERIAQEVLLQEIVRKYRRITQEVTSRPDSNSQFASLRIDEVLRDFEIQELRFSVTRESAVELERIFGVTQCGLTEYLATAELDFKKSDTELVAHLMDGSAQVPFTQWLSVYKVSDLLWWSSADEVRVGPFIFIRCPSGAESTHFRKRLMEAASSAWSGNQDSARGSSSPYHADQFAESTLRAMATEGGLFVICKVFTGFVPRSGAQAFGPNDECRSIRDWQTKRYFNLFGLALIWGVLPERGRYFSVGRRELQEGQRNGILLPTTPICEMTTTESLWQEFPLELEMGWDSRERTERICGLLEDSLADYCKILGSGFQNRIIRKLDESITFVLSGFGIKGEFPIVGLTVATESILNPFKRRNISPSDRFAKLGAAMITDDSKNRRVVREDLLSAYRYRSSVLHSMDEIEILLQLNSLKDPTATEVEADEDDEWLPRSYEQENMMFEYYLRVFIAVSRWLKDYIDRNEDTSDKRMGRAFDDYCAKLMQW